MIEFYFLVRIQNLDLYSFASLIFLDEVIFKRHDSFGLLDVALLIVLFRLLNQSIDLLLLFFLYPKVLQRLQLFLERFFALQESDRSVGQIKVIARVCNVIIVRSENFILIHLV